jgi:hypothetical protein
MDDFCHGARFSRPGTDGISNAWWLLPTLCALTHNLILSIV